MKNKGYPNHYIMKQQRLIKLNQANYICEDCGINKATEIHHIDRNKANHFLFNLKAICKPCHIEIHKKSIGRPLKFKMSIMKLSKEIGISHPTLLKYIKGNRNLNKTTLQKIVTFF